MARSPTQACCTLTHRQLDRGLRSFVRWRNERQARRALRRARLPPRACCPHPLILPPATCHQCDTVRTQTAAPARTERPTWPSRTAGPGSRCGSSATRGRLKASFRARAWANTCRLGWGHRWRATSFRWLSLAWDGKLGFKPRALPTNYCQHISAWGWREAHRRLVLVRITCAPAPTPLSVQATSCGSTARPPWRGSGHARPPRKTSRHAVHGVRRNARVALLLGGVQREARG